MAWPETGHSTGDSPPDRQSNSLHGNGPPTGRALARITYQQHVTILDRARGPGLSGRGKGAVFWGKKGGAGGRPDKPRRSTPGS